MSVIAPFEYTSLVWSFLLGALIWGDVPRGAVFLGAALIVAAGRALSSPRLIIIASEQLKRRPPPAD